jgi:hypothetical protein
MDARLLRAGTYATIAVAMALVVGAAGFVAGRGTADVDGAFDQGWTAGEASARDAANARYGEGGAGREAIARAAYSRGRSAGVRVGRRRGLADGRRQGIRKGEQSAFAGFDGGWRVGRWYAVRIGHGEGARGYSLPARVPLEGGRAYRLCGGAVCSIARGPASSPARPASERR